MDGPVRTVFLHVHEVGASRVRRAFSDRHVDCGAPCALCLCELVEHPDLGFGGDVTVFFFGEHVL